MKMNVRINYPCKLSKEQDDAQYRSICETLECQEVTSADLQLAYRVEKDTLRKDGKPEYTDYFYHEGKVFRKVSAYDSLGRYISSTSPNRVFDVAITCDPMPNLKQKYKYIQKHRDEAVRLAQEFIDSEYLLVDGEPYVQSDLEPVYAVFFEQLRKYAGISVVFVHKGEKKKSYFSALDKEAAIAKANALAELMSDSPLHECMIENIEVFMPELITYPRVEPVITEMTLPLEMRIEGQDTPEYRCPECHTLLYKEWSCCPRCKESLCWDETVVLIPGKIHCKECGCWIGTINRDGSSYASSHYNGTDVCDSCMVEHCCGTNCLACEIGEYPNCRFQDMKRHYMESDD